MKLFQTKDENWFPFFFFILLNDQEKEKFNKHLKNWKVEINPNTLNFNELFLKNKIKHYKKNLKFSYIKNSENNNQDEKLNEIEFESDIYNDLNYIDKKIYDEEINNIKNFLKWFKFKNSTVFKSTKINRLKISYFNSHYNGLKNLNRKFLEWNQNQFEKNDNLFNYINYFLINNTLNKQSKIFLHYLIWLNYKFCIPFSNGLIIWLNEALKNEKEIILLYFIELWINFYNLGDWNFFIKI